MVKRKRRKVKLATLIVMGEGPHDKAFLNHMKGLYDDRKTGQIVKIDSADGGSPRDIINSVIRKCRHTEFDRRYILLDSDVTIPQQDREKAKKAGIVLVESKPICIEGMLLDILGQSVPGTNQGCKDSLHPQLSGEPTVASSYAVLFTQDLLDNTEKEQIIVLRDAISNNS
ncbi:hypothetical protein ACFL2V_12515 [Pseudomonadota bacterium]